MRLQGCYMLGVLLCTYLSVSAQVCPTPTAEEIFHGNDIRTVMTNSGSLFQQYDGLFQVPFTGPQAPHVLLAGGLWLGGLDDAGNLKMAAQTFRGSNSFDYGPGPLTGVGNTNPDTCADWDKIWVVNRNEIQRHIADYEDNLQIDNPIPSIFGWPGFGNTAFESINGFPMLALAAPGAPFDDVNHNNLYEPELGEYPHPHQFDPGPIPMVLAWSVYNDNSLIHTSTGGDPLGCEIQLTMYAFSCEEQMLNETLFASYKIVNRSTSAIDSIYMAQWLAPSLGCYADDAIGSFPEGNTFFVYNLDNIDGDIGSECGTQQSYGKNPPVLSVTFLNKEMSSFTYYNNPATGNYPNAMIDPFSGSPIEFYRYMTGSWKDGTPFSEGGTGYNVPPVNQTKFAFAGDPNVEGTWAMTNDDIVFAERRILGSTKLPKLNPGTGTTIDLAFTYHRDTALSNRENVTLMYERIPQLQEMYDNGFSADCNYLSAPCQDDCIYPGDTDHDGNVGLKDYVNVALGQQAIGPDRQGPLSFLPLYGEEWGRSTEDSVNFKHVDCTGNGKVEFDDFAIIDLHYGNQAFWHKSVEQEFGDGIQIVPERSQMLVGENFFKVEVNFASLEIDSLYGLVFAFEYDTDIFDAVIPSLYQPPFEGGLVKRYSEEGREEYISVATDLTNRSVEAQLVAELSFFGNDAIDFTPPVDTTYFRITNVKAVLADGTILDLHGQEVPIYLVEELTSTDDPIGKGFRIFPNPTRGTISIENTDLPIGTPFTVFSSTGRAVTSGKLKGDLITVDLPSGLFYVVVYSDVVRTEKLIVMD